MYIFFKHTISFTFLSSISSPPLQFAWGWDPFTLPLTSLDNPQHLHHMMNELRNKNYKIQTNLTDPQIFENITTNINFKFNKTAIIIWLTLALTSTLYLILFIISFTLYLRQCKNANSLVNTQNHDPNHLYEPLQMQPLPYTKVNPFSKISAM
jgi:hypothetical protein